MARGSFRKKNERFQKKLPKATERDGHGSGVQSIERKISFQKMLSKETAGHWSGVHPQGIKGKVPKEVVLKAG